MSSLNPGGRVPPGVAAYDGVGEGHHLPGMLIAER